MRVKRSSSNQGLFNGLAPFVSEEADRAQLNRGPKLLGKALATSLVRRNKVAPPEKKTDGSSRS